MDSFSNDSNPQTSLADVNDRSNNNTPLVLNNSDNGKVQYNGIPTELETYYCFYKMNHKKQGIAYIFNHENFQNPKQCSKRKGTDEDARKLSTTLKNLKFDVSLFKDLKKEDIKHHIEQVSRVNHSEYNSIFIVVLSHGSDNMLCAYDESYDPYEIFWDQLTADKCPTLAGKPKLFLFQACQGNKTDPGTYIGRKTEFDGNDPYMPINTVRIPIAADFLIMYSTSKGYYAFRNSDHGSYYVTVLCDALEKLAFKMDILNILTIVNRQVAVNFTSRSKEEHYNDKKQMPLFTSSLTKILQFEDVSNGGEIEEILEELQYINLEQHNECQ